MLPQAQEAEVHPVTLEWSYDVVWASQNRQENWILLRSCMRNLRLFLMQKVFLAVPSRSSGSNTRASNVKWNVPNEEELPLVVHKTKAQEAFAEWELHQIIY